ncbi:unnamed protein product [Caenorhabditis bovis]|uniref:Uncharacterized protein n=1 Tax=Caenorhabditis bovis TaxID=2654633 RepID=A0A8S1EK63_9PELO|nr:unnamed protein product [Caenorhabditis bovis]
MKRIQEIRDHLKCLEDFENHLEQCDEWNAVAQDIIQKLTLLRRDCDRSLTPPHSASSSGASIYSAPDNSFNATDTVYEEAADAYDRQIYSRCVRIVETANRESPVEMCLISLAHHSYAEMVNAADASSDDAVKFATWWAEFLDSVEAGRAHHEKIELLDYEAIALERLFRIRQRQGKCVDENVEKLLEVVIRSFEMVSLINRPYHLMAIQRLLRLANILEGVEIDNGGCEHDTNNKTANFFAESTRMAKSALESGLEAIVADRRKFVAENSGADFRCDECVRQILDLEMIADENFPEIDIVVRL